MSAVWRVLRPRALRAGEGPGGMLGWSLNEHVDSRQSNAAASDWDVAGEGEGCGENSGSETKLRLLEQREMIKGTYALNC